MGDRRRRRSAHGRGAGERARRAVRPRRLALKPGRVLLGDLAEKSFVGLVRTEALLLDVAQGGLVHAVGAPPVRVAVLARAPPGVGIQQAVCVERLAPREQPEAAWQCQCVE